MNRIVVLWLLSLLSNPFNVSLQDEKAMKAIL